MFSIKHLFHTAKADGTDSTLVKPSNWNDEHVVLASTTGVVMGRTDAGAGPMQELPLSSLIPPGFVLPFAGATPPAGWLVCDGRSLLRSDFLPLFGVLGSYYGAVDGAHFSLPDLRGRVVAGVDGGAGRIGSYVSPILGGAGGIEYDPAQNLVMTVFGIADVSGNVTVWSFQMDGPDNTTAVTGGGGGAAGANHHHGNVGSQRRKQHVWQHQERRQQPGLWPDSSGEQHATDDRAQLFDQNMRTNMAKDKQLPEPEPMVEVVPPPQLSERTLAEMDVGRKQAATNAATFEAALKRRGEEAANKG